MPLGIIIIKNSIIIKVEFDWSSLISSIRFFSIEADGIPWNDDTSKPSWRVNVNYFSNPKGLLMSYNAQDHPWALQPRREDKSSRSIVGLWAIIQCIPYPAILSENSSSWWCPRLFFCVVVTGSVKFEFQGSICTPGAFIIHINVDFQSSNLQKRFL